jgi:2,4-dienoyl-CoA reductase-like NADH-dependent reductase (Old Yellow Enzyme family)
MNKYILSLSPIKLGNIILKNKIVCSPTGINMSEKNGTITDLEIDYFSNLSKNNLGMIIVGNATVSNMGKGAPNEIVIGKPFHLEPLKKLAKTIMSNGSVACIQIAHKGAQGNTKYTGERVVGPSKYIVPDIGIEAEKLTIDEIKEIENQYVNAIIQADEAGFQLIEIMSAHGYLVHQFLSEHTNKRDDEYGGSEVNRLRFLKNILEKVKKSIDTSKLAAKVTGNDFLPKGLNFKKIKFLIDLFDDYNFAYYQVTAGIYETAKQKYIHMKKGAYWEYAKELKKITKTPVMAQGGITSLEEGERILQNKQGDFWGMAQALIADPQLVTKTINNQEDQIYKCLAHIKVGVCHRCRYLKQKDLDFACVTPGSWSPDQGIEKNRFKRSRDIEFWKKVTSNLKNS